MFGKYNDTYKPSTEILWDYSYEIVENPCTILRRRREEFDLTQQQVADKAGIQLRQYTRLENGERSVSGVSMRIGLAVCRALELDPFRFG